MFDKIFKKGYEEGSYEYYCEEFEKEIYKSYRGNMFEEAELEDFGKVFMFVDYDGFKNEYFKNFNYRESKLDENSIEPARDFLSQIMRRDQRKIQYFRKGELYFLRIKAGEIDLLFPSNRNYSGTIGNKFLKEFDFLFDIRYNFENGFDVITGRRLPPGGYQGEYELAAKELDWWTFRLNEDGTISFDKEDKSIVSHGDEYIRSFYMHNMSIVKDYLFMTNLNCEFILSHEKGYENDLYFVKNRGDEEKIITLNHTPYYYNKHEDKFLLKPFDEELFESFIKEIPYALNQNDIYLQLTSLKEKVQNELAKTKDRLKSDEFLKYFEYNNTLSNVKDLIDFEEIDREEEKDYEKLYEESESFDLEWDK